MEINKSQITQRSPGGSSRERCDNVSAIRKRSKTVEEIQRKPITLYMRRFPDVFHLQVILCYDLCAVFLNNNFDSFYPAYTCNLRVLRTSALHLRTEI